MTMLWSEVYDETVAMKIFYISLVSYSKGDPKSIWLNSMSYHDVMRFIKTPVFRGGEGVCVQRVNLCRQQHSCKDHFEIPISYETSLNPQQQIPKQDHYYLSAPWLVVSIGYRRSAKHVLEWTGSFVLTDQRLVVQHVDPFILWCFCISPIAGWPQINCHIKAEPVRSCQIQVSYTANDLTNTLIDNHLTVKVVFMELMQLFYHLPSVWWRRSVFSLGGGGMVMYLIVFCILQ